MQIRVWRNFSKRYNSTKRAQGGTVVNVNLKEPTSKESPSFTLSADYDDVNYIKWGDHYYYVNNVIRVTNDLIQIDCKQDLLATFKNDIMNTTAFIERSSSFFSDNIVDNLVSATNIVESHVENVGESVFSTNGCYVLTLVNDQISVGMPTYICEESDIKEFALWLTGLSEDDTPDIVNYFIAHFSDCFSCVKSCIYLPIPFDVAKGSATTKDTIRVGKFNTTAQGVLIKSRTPLRETLTIDISDLLPSDFRKSEPYTKTKLYIPFYNFVDIDATLLTPSLLAEFDIDICTGEVFFKLFTQGAPDVENLVVSVVYNCGISVPISQVGIFQLKNATNEIIGTLASAGASSISGIIQNGFGVISAVATAGIHTVGSLSGNSMVRETSLLFYVTSMITTPLSNLALMGRPCRQFATIGLLSGYCQTVGASVDCDAYGDDKITLNSMLDAGFYIE